ncbi:YfcC family protein [Lentibacillus amyloliquefaciens]|uniref:C4-dicarboxylate ABC transporter n=1 Tax=Lentibacillus amyloliquefaciens TaxID=1472767 RepID=A0A0U4F4H3_9BACI|nr:YfcC family protein [Lentibacillus amyloliquefaciens]ALX48486.1 C4-dicarboxylate ABC transporter [Lentibacillus amyloliquefaciens]
MKGNETKKRKFQMPHIYVILFVLSAIAAILTYIIPAGKFERVPGPEGRTTIDPNSFSGVEQTPVGIVDFLTVIPRGLIDAGEVVFFTFIIGGMFMVLRHTGIIEIAVDKLTRKFSNKSLMLIPILTTVFAVIATVIGTPELSLVYIPVIMPLMIALGYDSLVAAAIALCGTVIGFAAGVLNPINTGLAQKISGIPVFSGIGFRLIIFVVIVLAAVFYIMRYAKKVKQNPLNSLVYEDDQEKREQYQDQDQVEEKHMNTRQKYASIAAFIFFGILVYGVVGQGWFMVEMAGLFIIMGIVVGIIAGLTLTEICEGFNQGFRDVLMGAMIVGIARAVAVVMEDGQIMDTIVHGLGSAVNELPPVLGAVGMYFVQLIINFFIPSGSGQALVTMPIMAPLSDIIGVTRQTAILAFQLGDGFAHILYPTSGYFMAALSIAGVQYQKWIRFFFPLFLILAGISVVSLIIAQVIQWS